MIFSEKWLREWVNPAVGTDELMAQLTMAGLEVDGHAPAAGDFSDVVVAEVEAVEAHPSADKLSVCRVNDGRNVHQVVCGAPNVRAGMKSPLALPGARLGPDFQIKTAKLRGVESQGMLCSSEELGLAEHAEGILELDGAAPVGKDLRAWLGLDDTLIEVDLTPNRGDCLSIAGLAREVGVLNRLAVSGPSLEPVPAELEDSLPIELEAPAGCPRYLGRVIRDVDPRAETPLWLREKLRRCGLRSIDPIVDVTNYVLMELGQPLHAFDLDKLEGGIRVRMAGEGETLELLDGTEVTLRPDTLLIADHRKPLAMAGIMGGRDSAVTGETRHILLESAFFDPLTITGKARSYGLQTDAAQRFERGVDYELPIKAMERATRLLREIAGGRPGPVIEAVAELPRPPEVTLRRQRIERLLGVAIPDEEVEDILGRLGMRVQAADEGWRVLPPSYRFDIALEADLIEELARIHGYDRLPVTEPSARFGLKPLPEGRMEPETIKRTLVTLGYQEVITYSFVDPELEQRAALAPGQAITLANPISQDMAVMRSTIWPGLLKTLQYNQNRQQSRVRIFETGLRFTRADGEVQQTPGIAGLAWGPRMPEQWGESRRECDFYDIKGDVESILTGTLEPGAFTFHAAEHPALQPGQSAEILRDGRHAGWIGALEPGLQRWLDIDGKVLLFELDLETVTPAAIPQAGELSRFPQIRRDIAVIVDATLETAEILATIQECAGGHLVDITLFDVYQGENIAKDKKSLALGLTFQHPSRTLNDDEVNEIIDSCVKALEAQFKAELRK